MYQNMYLHESCIGPSHNGHVYPLPHTHVGKVSCIKKELVEMQTLSIPAPPVEGKGPKLLEWFLMPSNFLAIGEFI